VASDESDPPRRPRVAFLVPGGISGVTGGNLYDRAVIGALERRGWSVAVADRFGPASYADVVVVDSLSLRHGPPPTHVPVVVLLHQVPSEAEKRPEWTRAEAASLRGADLVIAVGEGVAASARDLGAHEAIVIAPGWDGAAADYRAARPDRLLSVANAHPGKGIPEAVEAYTAADRLGQRLTLVGDLRRDPVEARRVRAALRRCPRPIERMGVVETEELSSLYARAAVLLTASRYEGWPIAVAEAMASGVPVVGFDVPGVRELVRSGHDGLLVPPGDVPALADALSRVASDAGLAGSLGSAGRRRARSCPRWETTGRRFAEELERLLRGSGGQPPREQSERIGVLQPPAEAVRGGRIADDSDQATGPPYPPKFESDSYTLTDRVSPPASRTASDRNP
jgi:glycosyltransferase involved in cell wall biosynthesis